MKMSGKLLAVAIVAMFCVTAFAVVADENDAADSKTYHFYVEILDEKGELVVGQWHTFTCEKNNSAWAAQATSAFQSVMASYVNSVRDYYVVGNEEGVRFYYDSDEFWPACYYSKDGKWALVSDTATEYINADNTAIVMYPPSLYMKMFYATELPVGADAKDYIYVEESWGSYYMKLPNAGVPNNSDMTLYLIIGAIVVIAIVVIGYFFLKKKNA